MICFSFAALFLVACGGEKAPAVEETVEEVVTVDSAAVEMHNATEEIENSVAELDELLENL